MKIFLTQEEKQREFYKEILNKIEEQYMLYDLKIKEKKIIEESRKIIPVFSVEQPGLENFNDLIKKIYSSSFNNYDLNDIEIQAFVFIDKSLTLKKDIPISNDFIPAIISPFPDKIRYEVAMLNKNLGISSGDFISIKKFKVKYFLTDKNSTIATPLIYIENAEKIDAIKAYRTSKNLKQDFYDYIHSMLPEDTNEEDIKKIGAGILSANNGMSFSSVTLDKNMRETIKGIYIALQNSLPKIFRNEKFDLKFEPNAILKGQTINITINSQPLFLIHNKNEIVPFSEAFNNQTIASVKLYKQQMLKNEEILSIFRNANLINEYGIFKPINLANNPEEPIYDEELHFWIISQRNFFAKSFEDENLKNFFEKIFSKVVGENFDWSIPKNCLNLVAKNTIFFESFRRGFDGFYREGISDNYYNAKEFIGMQLTQISKFTFEFGEKFREEMSKTQKIEDEYKKIYDLIYKMVNLAGQLPLDETINAIHYDTNYSKEEIENFINSTIRKKTEIKVNKNMNKIGL